MAASTQRGSSHQGQEGALYPREAGLPEQPHGVENSEENYSKGKSHQAISRHYIHFTTIILKLHILIQIILISL